VENVQYNKHIIIIIIIIIIIWMWKESEEGEFIGWLEITDSLFFSLTVQNCFFYLLKEH